MICLTVISPSYHVPMKWFYLWWSGSLRTLIFRKVILFIMDYSLQFYAGSPPRKLCCKDSEPRIWLQWTEKEYGQWLRETLSIIAKVLDQDVLRWWSKRISMQGFRCRLLYWSSVICCKYRYFFLDFFFVGTIQTPLTFREDSIRGLLRTSLGWPNIHRHPTIHPQSPSKWQ